VDDRFKQIRAGRELPRQIVGRLAECGFATIAGPLSGQQFSELADRQGSKDFAAEKNTKAPEGATTGVGIGGAVGGTLGLLAGIGALAIPGVGPLIAAGPIMGALAGLGVGGTVGGVVGALIGLGIPEYEAKRYEGRVKDGGVLLSVHCDSSQEVSRAKDLLKATGAEDISSSGEKSVSTHGVDTNQGKVGSGQVRDVETERIGVSRTTPIRPDEERRDREIG
jgi:hypothetical protein